MLGRNCLIITITCKLWEQPFEKKTVLLNYLHLEDIKKY